MNSQLEMREIPLDLIDEDASQPRSQFDEEAIEELMNSIAELGLLSPIKVRKLDNGRYKIIYGNRRYIAAKKLGRRTIACIVSDVTDEREIYLEQIAENLTREGFTPIEEAEAYDKLMNDPKFSSSIKYLSSKLGKSESYIRNKLELLQFDAKVRRLVVSGTEIRKDKLTEGQLLPLKDLPMEHRDALALIVARDELPVSDVKRIAKLFKAKDISAATKDKLLYKSGHELMQTWSTYETNRAERARRAAEAAETAEAAEAVEAVEHAAASAAKTDEREPIPATSNIIANEAASAPDPLAQINAQLRQLLAVLPAETVAEPDAIPATANMESQEILNGINDLTNRLESHLHAWNRLKQQLASRTQQ